MKFNVERLARDLDLEVLYPGHAPEFELDTSNLNRPGLFLAGYEEYFNDGRLQVIGRAEQNYLLRQLSAPERGAVLERLLARQVPCLILTRGMEPLPELMAAVEKQGCPLLAAREPTTHLMQVVSAYIEAALAPRCSIHGVMVDVNGVGMLLLGESGIGKSETALELVERGHRLVADDVVTITKVDQNQLMATSPETIQHFMEIRGIGIINVRSLFGVGSVLMNKTVELVICLENWDQGRAYDRLGLQTQYYEILDTQIPMITVPVLPGRNLAIVLEVAARNHQMKAMGYNAAEDISRRFEASQKGGEG